MNKELKSTGSHSLLINHDYKINSCLVFGQICSIQSHVNIKSIIITTWIKNFFNTALILMRSWISKSLMIKGLNIPSEVEKRSKKCVEEKEI